MRSIKTSVILLLSPFLSLNCLRSFSHIRVLVPMGSTVIIIATLLPEEMIYLIPFKDCRSAMLRPFEDMASNDASYTSEKEFENVRCLPA